MDWQNELLIMIDALGSDTTEAQETRLENWILDNVPVSYWSNIAEWLPSRLATEFYMRSAEMGLC